MYYLHVSCGRYMKAFVSTYVRDDNAPVKTCQLFEATKSNKTARQGEMFLPSSQEI